VDNRIRSYLPGPPQLVPVLLGSFSLAGRAGQPYKNFLIFHCLAEAFAISDCHLRLRHLLEHPAVPANRPVPGSRFG